MGLNDVTSGERVHIGFFGRRNAGKSSLVNAVTGQALSVVSDVRGTTTDPVKKAMELLPVGPVMIIDTPGYDDEGTLGHLRVEKTREILAKTDVAVLVVDAALGIGETEKELLALFAERKIPVITAFNKADLLTDIPAAGKDEIFVSAVTGTGIEALKNAIGALAKNKGNTKRLVADLLAPGDFVMLVIPIDESAPKGRLILPQQQTIRDILDSHVSVVCCQDTEVAQTLAMLAKKPKLVITDSQAFGRVSKDVPEDIMLTSFSILFARYKGDLATLVRGAAALSTLRDGDKVLISEGCTHHRQCGDIGSVKIPGWIEKYTGAKPEYAFTSGGEFPADLSAYKVVVHCGGCMLNEAEMGHRIRTASAAGVPMVNYGIAIAHMHGILKRSLEPFPEMLALLDN
ncbi:MAG: [FeFe] hydrogenase H-cluster maturation GTPase HydF [Ruminococcaceae bacterium]|nr:[FeFe] hydrogenase H-cluster maturation GTPase HydF [Oscillospiraceae bacterium]